MIPKINFTDIKNRTSYDLGNVFLLSILAVVVTVPVFYYLYSTFTAATNHYRIGYEGYVMYMSADWSTWFTPLQEPPYVVTIYPPVYMIIAGLTDRIVDNIVLSSRIVSIASGLVATVAVWKIVDSHSENANTWVAIIVAILFLTHPYVVRRSVTARPDILATAFTGIALYIYLNKEGYKQLVGVGVFILLALFTKQNFIALPIAISLSYILDYNWKRSVVWSTAVIASGLSILLLLTVMTDGIAWEQLVVVNSSLDFSISRFLTAMLVGFRIHVILLGIAVLAIVKEHSKIPNVVLIYTITSSITLIFLGKMGSGNTIFFQQLLVLPIISGMLLSNTMPKIREILESSDITKTQIIFIILIICQLGLYIQTPNTYDSGAPRAEEIMQSADGPVLSEDMVLSAKHNRDDIYQSFIYAQLVEAGYLDETPVTDDIRNKEYEKIILWHDICSYTSNRWTTEQANAIINNYQLEESPGGYWIYEPKSEQQSANMCENYT